MNDRRTRIFIEGLKREVEGCDWMWVRSLFQSVGAIIEKALSPGREKWEQEEKQISKNERRKGCRIKERKLRVAQKDKVEEKKNN